MKKVIFLFLIFTFVFSSNVFASTFPPPPNGSTIYIIYKNAYDEYRLATSTTQFISNGQNSIQGTNITRYNWNGSSWESPTVVGDGLSTGTYSYATHDLYDANGSLVFLGASPYLQGMEGAKSRLLSQILIILPIILGGVVLFLGLRKALTMLFRSLARA